MIGMPPYIPGEEDMTPEELNTVHGEWYSKFFAEKEKAKMSSTPLERTPPGQTKGVDVTKSMMPSYMTHHFNKAIKLKRKTANYLAEQGYQFYVCEHIYSEITGGRRYNGREIITFKGVRIRMSTTRALRECNLSCYRHNNESTVNFIIPTPRKASQQPVLRFINRLKWLCSIRLDFNGWSLMDIVVPYYHQTTDKPKRKHNGEQMATLGELFEGYEDTERKEAMRDYVDKISRLRMNYNQNIHDAQRDHADELVKLQRASRDEPKHLQPSKTPHTIG